MLFRSDSTRISEEAREQADQYIENSYSRDCLAHKENDTKNKGKIQDAHEAIRPTDINRTPVVIKESLSRDLFRLYQLIWKRFTASCMANAKYETTSVKIDANDYRFTVATSKVIFEGFRNVYMEADEEKVESNTLLKSIDQDSKL